MRRVIRISLAIGVAFGLLAPSAGLSGPATAGSPPGVVPLGVAVNANACDPSGQPVPTDPAWPAGETVVIPICHSNSGIMWLDFSPAGGGVAELIADIETPRPTLAVPQWIYAAATFNINNSNLEFALNEQAGNPLRLPMIDATCIEPPSSGTDPCASSPGQGANLWAHAIYLRTFTIESAHITSDLTPCGLGPFVACLIGTFSYPAAPFTDVGGNPFRAHIEWAFAADITAGCSPELFCPKAPVHRDEMATFLDRMFDLAETGDDWFDDDDGNLHEAAINRVAAAGISNGCGAYRFCPTAPVLREQMVTFLHRLEEPIEPPPFPAP